MIFTECYNDTELIKFLGFDFINSIVHSGTKSRVINDLLKLKSGIGVIDEDYNEKHPKLNNFEYYKEFMEIKLLKYRGKEMYIIIIPDNLEKWFIRMAKQLNLNINSTGILDSRKNIHKRFSRRELTKLLRFFELINPHKEFKKFKDWIDQYN